MQRCTPVKDTRKRKGIRYERVKEGGEGLVSEDPAWVVGDASDDDESEEEPTPTSMRPQAKAVAQRKK